MRLPNRITGLVSLAILLVPLSVFAQLPSLRFPEASQKASVSQRIGLTDISITYNRPGVNNRKIMGALVPYNEVWRAGANENTTISFTDAVWIEGKELAAGTYGIHMIPTPGEWTVVFSNETSAWGSFSYDTKEDALRIKATPRPSPFTERLSFTFENPTDDSATVDMRWENVSVPFKVTVEVPKVVLANIRKDLAGLPQFTWQAWNRAADYSLRNGGDLGEATAWSERSTSMNRNFQNLRTKAAIAEKNGETKMAADLRTEAMSIATEADINTYAYGLMNQKKMDEAMALFKKNVQQYPKSWNAYDSLAEAYATSGDKARAIENYSKARELAKDENQRKRISVELAKLKG